MTGRPNIVLITTDQQRWDTLGCAGNAVVRTPHIDRLAAEGVCFARAYAQSPLCMPSRASLITGRYPRAHGVMTNWVSLPAGEASMQDCLRGAGYTTAAVGKMHYRLLLNTGTEADALQSPPYGYDHLVLADGKYGVLSPAEDDYRTLLRQQGWFDASRDYWKDPAVYGAFEAVASPLPPELYIDQFIGDAAVGFLRRGTREPFFLWVSFCSPHHPFDPPRPYDTLYDPADMPSPHRREDELERKPPEYGAHLEQILGIRTGRPRRLTEEVVRRVIAYYYGMITLLDAQVARVLQVLREAALLERTAIVFASDHGEFLGDHGLLLKAEMLCDALVRVPLVVRYPARFAGGAPREEFVELVDLLPTMLDLAGVNVPARVQGRSLVPLCEGQGAGWRDSAFAEYEHRKMLRTDDWKLVWHSGKPWGELYDLRNDPHELLNLYDDPGYAARREALRGALLNRLVADERYGAAPLVLGRLLQDHA